MDLKTKPLSGQINAAILSGEPLIVANDLGIKYEGEKERRGDFKSIIHNNLTFNREKKFETIWALRGLSFTGYSGEVLGVIGPNGAGKTTLCRAILGLMKPDRGRITVLGEVSSLLSLGTGFNKDISGRENIRLNGMMLGLSKARLDELMPSIEEFTGLGRFLDHPLKYYSSGMKARLGFSIAASLEPEVLVIDEVLGTGDQEFKDRAVSRMRKLVSGAKMVVVVTHDVDFVEENCNRVLWLENGNAVAIGETTEVVGAYREKFSGRAKRRPKAKLVNLNETEIETSHEKAHNFEAGLEETIKLKDLGICFRLGKETFWALQDVSFSVTDKEIIGIIGPNGAGKTTLCQTLSGLYRPDRGSVKVKGDITALLTFGLGFNPQLTGYDNIYLNGMMMGIPKNKIRQLEKEIIEFSELQKVINRPIKEYSAGMKSRLGFSIAATLKPDVFVVDEALSAGDMYFREKATSRMQDLIEEAKTVILVTHSLAVVEKVCTRAIWLQKGKVIEDGDPGEVVSLYKESVRKYRRMQKVLPLKRDARLLQAAEHFGAGEYDLADTLLEEVVADRPYDLNLLIQYAEVAMARNKKVQAWERWVKLLEAVIESAGVELKKGPLVNALKACNQLQALEVKDQFYSHHRACPNLKTGIGEILSDLNGESVAYDRIDTTRTKKGQDNFGIWIHRHDGAALVEKMTDNRTEKMIYQEIEARKEELPSIFPNLYGMIEVGKINVYLMEYLDNAEAEPSLYKENAVILVDVLLKLESFLEVIPSLPVEKHDQETLFKQLQAIEAAEKKSWEVFNLAREAIREIFKRVYASELLPGHGDLIFPNMAVRCDENGRIENVKLFDFGLCARRPIGFEFHHFVHRAVFKPGYADFSEALLGCYSAKKNIDEKLLYRNAYAYAIIRSLYRTRRRVKNGKDIKKEIMTLSELCRLFLDKKYA